MSVKNNIWVCVSACTRVRRSLRPLFSCICLSVTLTRQCTRISSYLCASEKTGQCVSDLLFFYLCVHFGFHAFVFLCMCEFVHLGLRKQCSHSLGVFLGVLLSKWLSRIARTRPSKRTEISSLGLTFHPAIVLHLLLYLMIKKN